MIIKREIIYITLFMVVLLPIVFGITMKITPTQPVKKFYKAINNLKTGNYVLVSLSFDPSTQAELIPMLKGVTLQLLKKGVIPVYFNLQNVAIGDLGYETVKKIADKLNKKEDYDYYYLGYVPGDKMAIQRMGENFFKVYSTDFHDKKLSQFPIYNEIKTLKDFKYLIDISDGNSTIDYLTYVNTKYGVPIIAGVTAIMATEYYPYLNSGQLSGLLGGLRGAAEYETLLNYSGDARKGMSAQTFAHVLILLLIIIGNIEYFYFRKRNVNS